MADSSGAAKVEIRMLGGFEVLLDGAPVPAAGWPRPQAATLVKLLALAPGRRLHREQLVDRLWPDLTVAEAAPRLHKLAHYARRALGEDRTAIVLRNETVALLPDAEVVVDVDVFERAAEEALADGTPAAAAAAAATTAARCCRRTSTRRGPRTAVSISVCATGSCYAWRGVGRTCSSRNRPTRMRMSR